MNINDILDQVDETWAGHISTHYDGCWTRHAGCLAATIRHTLGNDDG